MIVTQSHSARIVTSAEGKVRSRRTRLLAGSALTAAAICAALPGSAQTVYQGAVGGVGNYNDTGNWVPADVPDASGEVAAFDDTGAAETTVDLGGVTVSPDYVTIGGTTGYTIQNGTFQLTGDTDGYGIVYTSSGDSTISANISGGDIYTGGSGSLTLSGTNTGITDIRIDGTSELIIDGANALPGTLGSVRVAGGFDLGGNTYAISSLIVQNGTVTNGTVDMTNVGQFQNATIEANLTGVGGFSTVGNGTIILSGTNTYSGDTNLNHGTIRLAADDALSANSDVYIASGVTLDLDGYSASIGDLNGVSGSTIDIGDSGALVVNQTANGEFAGELTGSSSFSDGVYLQKSGSGALLLSGTSSVTGNGIVLASGGILQVSNGDALGDDSVVQVSSTLELLSDETIGALTGTGNVVLTSGSLTIDGTGESQSGAFSGVISGDGGLTVGSDAGASYVQTLTGVNTYTGTTSVTGNTLSISGSGSIASTDIQLSGGELDTDGSAFASGATITQTGGLLDLNGSETITGYTITGGTTDFDGATFTVTNVSASDVTLNGGTISSPNDFLLDDVTVNSVLAGAGGVQTSGTVTFNSANTYTGDTQVTGGTLVLGASDVIADASDLSLTGGGTVDLDGFSEAVGSLTGDAGTTIDIGDAGVLSVNQTVAGTFAGDLTGSSSASTNYFVKSGSETLTLSGENTVTGGGYMTVAAGTLQLAGGNAVGDDNVLSVDLNATAELLANETIGGLLGDGTVQLNANRLTIDGYGTAALLSFTGDITGTGGVTLTSDGVTSGLQTFSSAQSYTGSTIIDGGTLYLLSDGALASTDIELSAGVLQSDGGAFASGATITQTGGLLTVSGDETFAGLDISGGTNNFSGATLTVTNVSASDVTLNGGTISSSNAIVLDNVIVESVLAGSGGIQTTGNVLLSAANTYTGDTVVNGGTLLIDADERIADSSDLILNNDATFDLDIYEETVASLTGSVGSTVAITSGGRLNVDQDTNTTFAGTLSGGSNAGEIYFQKSGTGALTLTGTNTVVGAGTFSVAEGTVVAASGSAIGDNNLLDIGAGGDVVLAANETIGALTGSGEIDTGADATGVYVLTIDGGFSEAFDVTWSGDITGDGNVVVASDGGTGALAQTFNSAQSYVGSTTVTGSKLALTGAGALASTDIQLTGGELETDGGALAAGATVTQTGGLLDINGNETFAGLNITGGTNDFAGATLTVTNVSASDVTLSGGTISSANDIILDDVTVNSVLAGAGGVQTSGTVTFNSANTYTGDTQITGGTLVLGAGNRIADNSDLVITGGGTFDLNGFGEAVGSLSGDAGTTIDLGLNGRLTVNQTGDSTYAGDFVGSTDSLNIYFTKAGTGTLTLSGTDNYVGVGLVTINEGTLRLSGGAAIADGSILTVNDLGTMELLSSEQVAGIGGDGDILLNDNVLTVGGLTGATLTTSFGGTISGTGDVAFINGDGVSLNSLQQTISSAQTYTGSTLVDGARLFLTGGGALASTDIQLESGELETDGGAFAAGATVTQTGGLLDINGNETFAGLNITGGTNDFAGATLTVTNVSASDVTLSGGTISSSNDFILTDVVVDSILAGTGGVVSDGNVLFAGANTYTGDTQVVGGTLTLDSDERIADTSNLVLTNDATFDMAGHTETVGGLSGTSDTTVVFGDGGVLNVVDNENTEFAGTFNVTSDFADVVYFSKSGTGTLLFSGTNLDTGNGYFVINDGVVQAASGSVIGDNNILQVTGNGTLELLADETIGAAVGNGTIALNDNDLTIDGIGLSTAALFSGTITGSGSVTLDDDGSGPFTQRIDSEQTYTGSTIVNANVLEFLSGGSIDSTAVEVNGGSLITAGGAFAADATVTQIGGVFDVNGDETIAALIVNGGITDVDGLATLTADSVEIGVDGTVNVVGSLVSTAGIDNDGTFDNIGIVTTATGLDNSGDLTNSGTVNGGVINSADLVTTGTINGGLTNTGSVDAEGEIFGAIVNSGTGDFELTGDLLANSTFLNSGTATLNVNGGDLLGVTTLTNESTADFGVIVQEGMTLGTGDTINAAGSTFQVSGRLDASGNVTNNGMFLVIETGLVDGDAIQAGGTFSLLGEVSGTMTVTGGSVFGTGTVGSLDVQGGTVQPGIPGGSTIGTLDVSGPVAFSGGTYEVEVAADGSNDLIDATGAAALSGGTVAPVLLDTETSYVAGQQFTILTADGGVSGAFGGISEDYELFDFTLSYDTNNAYLNFVLITDFAETCTGTNGNGGAIGLDGLAQTPGSDSVDLVNLLAGLDDDALCEASRQVAGQIFPAMLIEASLQLTANSQDLIGRALVGQPEGLSFYVEGATADGHIDHDNDLREVDSRTLGVTFGMDYRAAGNTFAAGIAGGYSDTDISLNDFAEEADTDGWDVGAYARFGTANTGFTASVAGNYLWQTADITRVISFTDTPRTASATDIDVEGWSAAGELRYGFQSGQGWAAGPMVSIEHTDAQIGSFAETGADSLNLSSAGGDYESTRYGGGVFFNRASGASVIDLSFQYMDGTEEPLLLIHELEGSEDAAFNAYTAQELGGTIEARGNVSADLGGGFGVNARFGFSFGADSTRGAGTIGLTLGF